MARPIKNGLDYFPFDVQFFSDDKILAVSVEYGVKGEISVVHLLCAIYRHGYFIEWNDCTRIRLLKELPGVSADLLDKVVHRLVDWGFFDKTLFDTAHVLTSRGIQSRYFSSYSRRSKTGLPYLLISDAKTGVIAARTLSNEPSLPFEDGQPDGRIIATKTEVVDVKTAETKVIAAKTPVNVTESAIKETKQNEDESSLRSDMSPGATQKSDKKDPLDFDAFVVYFNGKVKDTQIPTIIKLNKFRKGLLSGRVKEYGKESLATVVEKVVASTFLTGGTGQFIAKFDWIFRPRNYPKILEGNYDNTLNQTSNGYGANNISGYRPINKPTKQQRIREDLAEAAEHFRELIQPAEGSVHSSVSREVWHP